MKTDTYATITRWGQEDELFIVEVPGLPGCFADGPTRADAARNAERVIREWIDTAIEEGRAVPAPSLVD